MSNLPISGSITIISSGISSVSGSQLRHNIRTWRDGTGTEESKIKQWQGLAVNYIEVGSNFPYGGKAIDNSRDDLVTWGGSYNTPWNVATSSDSNKYKWGYNTSSTYNPTQDYIYQIEHKKKLVYNVTNIVNEIPINQKTENQITSSIKTRLRVGHAHQSAAPPGPSG
jgi:hypothetical protein